MHSVSGLYFRLLKLLNFMKLKYCFNILANKVKLNKTIKFYEKRSKM